MKKAITYFNRVLLKVFGINLTNRVLLYFQLFPSYWELIPVRLEKVVLHSNIKK